MDSRCGGTAWRGASLAGYAHLGLSRWGPACPGGFAHRRPALGLQRRRALRGEPSTEEWGRQPRSEHGEAHPLVPRAGRECATVAASRWGAAVGAPPLAGWASGACRGRRSRGTCRGGSSRHCGLCVSTCTGGLGGPYCNCCRGPAWSGTNYYQRMRDTGSRDGSGTCCTTFVGAAVPTAACRDLRVLRWSANAWSCAPPLIGDALCASISRITAIDADSDLTRHWQMNGPSHGQLEVTMKLNFD